jgi:transcriptional regulator with XRE-family HTH domain
MESTFTGLKVATFKERFNELCENNPRNASRIADNLHVSRQTVSAWRSGYRSPKEPRIIAIANHFRVTVPWLMGFDVDKNETVEESTHIVIQNMNQFSHLLQYMTQEEYETVVTAFDMAYQRMKEKGKEP